MRSVLLTFLMLLPGLAEAQVAVLNLSTKQLSFLTSGTSQFPPSQQVRIRNAGSGSLDWRATTSTPWLRVSPAEGTAPATLVVTIETSALSAGDYTGRVTVTATKDADDSPATIDVILKLVEASKTRPEPAGAPVSPTAPVRPDSNPPPAEGQIPQVKPPAPVGSRAPGLTVSSAMLPAGARNLPYSQAVPIKGGTPPYLVQLLQGRLPPGLALANGAVSGVCRVPGVYQFVLGITDSSKPPQRVSMPMALRVLTIYQDTALMVVPPAVSIVIMGNQPQPPARLNVSSGAQPLDWHASSDVAWLRVVPADGISPGVVQLDVITQGLAAGTYVATVTVMMEGVANSPARIPVELVVRK